MDGVLTKAIETGQWVLLDNANLCSATVLDRLNPLLEPGGVLLLNECGTSSGQPRILRPHPNFRLILAQDHRQVHINLACPLLSIFLEGLNVPAGAGQHAAAEEVRRQQWAPAHPAPPPHPNRRLILAHDPR